MNATAMPLLHRVAIQQILILMIAIYKQCGKWLFLKPVKPMLLLVGGIPDTKITADNHIQQTKAKLLILDPLQAYLGANVDMHRANEIRPVFHKLEQIAEDTGCAVVSIGHMNKGGGKSSYRGLGSIGITAAARSVLVVGKSPQDPNIRIMAHSKSNLAPAGESIVFSLGDCFRFLGTSAITVDELLGLEAVKRSTMDEAKAFLLRTLTDGKQESKLVLEAAKEQGLSERTLKTAKEALGVKATKVGNKWYSELPCQGKSAK